MTNHSTTLTSLKLADLALLEMDERLTPSLLFLYALSQALRRYLLKEIL